MTESGGHEDTGIIENEPVGLTLSSLNETHPQHHGGYLLTYKADFPYTHISKKGDLVNRKAAFHQVYTHTLQYPYGNT